MKFEENKELQKSDVEKINQFNMDTNDDECLTKTSSSVLNTHDLVIVRDFLNGM